MRIGNELLIGSQSLSEQGNASIAALANGQFAVVWEGIDSIDADVFGRIFHADTQTATDMFRVNQATGEYQGVPDVAGLGNGGFAVIWGTNESPSYISPILVGRVFDGDGSAVTGEFSLSANPKLLAQAGTISAFEDDGFIVSHINVSTVSGFATGQFSQTFDSEGNSDGIQVELSGEDASSLSQGTILEDGTAFVVWRVFDTAIPNGPYAVYGRNVDSEGAPIGDVVDVLGPRNLDYSNFQIASLPGNKFVLTWRDESGDLGSLAEVAVYGQIFQVDGTAMGDKFLVSDPDSIDNFGPAVTELSDGGFLVGWMSGNSWDANVYVQQFDAAGEKVGQSVQLNSDGEASRYTIDLETLKDGRVVSTWTSVELDVDIISRIIDPRNEAVFLVGTELDDEYVGTVFADEMFGALGNDRLSGNVGDDVLLGGTGDDMLNGDAGADVLDGQHGDDFLEGGAGNDVLIGGAGNDSLHGSLNDDDLDGGHGSDWLDGGLGNDSMRGGAGPDTFAFGNGADVVGDFQNNSDTILFDQILWGGGIKTPEEILDYAAVAGDDTVFDFGNGNTLTVSGWANPVALLDDIGMI